ncbi:MULTISPECIES: hypothetical protein [Nocardioides]|uniref:Uncharacterized protein n=1 Tax=Nocardioides vastitatis TaxID=2568655 RepID=A0ABW0ZJW8_9ACTN|nr:hypothetical protein [Nocardioides sp.]THJ01631.1 hypothetical protein E7Z54_11100 [Nocardioides sp.]
MGAKAKSPTLAPLAELLGVDEEQLLMLRRYDAGKIETLQSAVAEALEAEDAAFATASEDALRLVPRLLRGPARAMLLPGGRRG